MFTISSKWFITSYLVNTFILIIKTVLREIPSKESKPTYLIQTSEMHIYITDQWIVLAAITELQFKQIFIMVYNTLKHTTN